VDKIIEGLTEQELPPTERVPHTTQHVKLTFLITVGARRSTVVVKNSQKLRALEFPRTHWIQCSRNTGRIGREPKEQSIVYNGDAVF
jgi:hypothetical protein